MALLCCLKLALVVLLLICALLLLLLMPALQCSCCVPGVDDGGVWLARNDCVLDLGK